MTIRRTRCASRVALLATALVLVADKAVGAEASAVPPVSVVQVPLELDLQPLFAAAEASLPTRTGHWPGWRDWHGIDTRYRAWRGPLRLEMQGEVLQAQAHVRYQVQARKGLIGRLALSAGCGVDEPPRQALIGLLARLDWGPDWSLHPQFRILPTRFLDRCEVTVASIDISPLVGEVFEERIQSSLSKAMSALAPRLSRLREEAARVWQSVQKPRELTPGLWLRVEPQGFALAPPQGSGSRVQTAVWLAFRATVSGDAATVARPTPLPPLIPYRPVQPGLNFSLGLSLDYPWISSVLSERLAGQTLKLEGKQARVDGVSLSGRGEDLVLAADLAGDLTGRLTILGRPGFDVAGQTLRLDEVGFVFDAANPDQGLIANLFYDRIRERIESEVNALLAERTIGLQDALATNLAQGLPPNLKPNLTGLRIANLRIQVGEAGLAFEGSAQGAITLGGVR